MTQQYKPELTIVIPIYNEAGGLLDFNNQLIQTLSKLELSYEVIYVNDGSTDDTIRVMSDLKHNQKIKMVSLSKNFGKENALTAGISLSKGKAILTMDGDGQHPVELISGFVKAWREQERIVIGIRKDNSGIGILARVRSAIFHTVFNLLTGQKLIPGSTDYRLIDESIKKEFLKLTETDRITRGLIDWLGFQPKYLYFVPNRRNQGESSYDTSKLLKLAVSSFTSLSPKPLYIFGWIGITITIFSLILGISVLVEQLLLNDPLSWNFTGTAMLGILVLFMVGIILMSQGILSLYISSIHNQTKNRPLYVIDYRHTTGFNLDSTD